MAGPGCAVVVFVGHGHGCCCDGAVWAVATAAAVGEEVHVVGHVGGCGGVFSFLCEVDG